MQHQIAVNFVGKVIRDPELKDTRSRTGKILVIRLMSFGGGRPNFIDLIALDGAAVEYAERFTKGDVVEGTGELTYSEWETKPRGRARAQKVSKHSVLLDEIDHAS